MRLDAVWNAFSNTFLIKRQAGFWKKHIDFWNVKPEEFRKMLEKADQYNSQDYESRDHFTFEFDDIHGVRCETSYSSHNLTEFKQKLEEFKQDYELWEKLICGI